jgi:tRNA 2-thiouridine synthesizing protein A
MGVDQGSSAVGAPESEAQPAGGKVVRYDCGWIGCDETPMVVRRQLQGVDVGDIIEFRVCDPSSKEDTPSFCRMLGHRVISIDPQEDGAHLIRVERAR